MTAESPNTTATDEEEESLLQWECARVQFVQRIVDTVIGYNFLSAWLTTAFKFYINKTLLYFLNRSEVKVLREAEGCAKVEEKVREMEIKIIDQLKYQHNLLLKN